MKQRNTFNYKGSFEKTKEKPVASVRGHPRNCFSHAAALVTLASVRQVRVYANNASYTKDFAGLGLP